MSQYRARHTVAMGVLPWLCLDAWSLTDRRSAAGRALDQVAIYEDRDARSVRCNGWLSRLSCGREHVLPSVENRRLRTEWLRLRLSCCPLCFRDARVGDASSTAA